MMPAMPPTPPALYFPADPAVIDARKEFGAKGDGKTDDTEALQNALNASCGMDGKPTRVLFLRKGIYRLTKSLIVKNAVGPWLYGEDRDGVVLKLDDGVKDVTAVLRTHPNEKGPTSADWFMRNVYNLTVDAGKNPETDGIRWYATNSGILKNVRVIGNGKVGINAGFLDQSGPNLIQDATISGFETGILSQWIWGETLSRIRISDCRKTGVYVSANAVAIEDLTVTNTPQAMMVDLPNDWGHWSGVAALVGGKLCSPIGNRGVIYARDYTVNGKPQVELLAPARKSLGQSAPANPLPIRPEPRVPWDTNPKKWLCVNDFGAKAGDNQDDTEAFEKAFAEAHRRGASTVYLRGIGGGDPNWYNLKKAIVIPRPVRRVIGLGFGRILGEDGGGFVIDDSSSAAVQFLNIDSFGGPPITLTSRAQKNALLVESCGVKVIGDGAGPIFLTNCPASVDLRVPGQSLWARQLNPEGQSDDGLVKSNGGNLWALGVKCEGKGIRFATKNGARTEIYGAFMYTAHDTESDKRPMFLVEGASLSVFGLREISFTNICFPVKIKTPEKTITSQDEGGWIGWSRYDISAR
jgi:hypothetical protein